MAEKDLEKLITKILREQNEEFLTKTFQSGKQETSALFKQIDGRMKVIEASVTKNANEIYLMRKELQTMNAVDENTMKLHVEKEQQEERKTSDTKYAIKLVERIVFWGAALVGAGFGGALINLVIK